MTLAPWYTSAFELLEEHLNGERKSSLHQLRQEAHRELKRIGLPEPKAEEWKYTDLHPVRSGQFKLPKRPPADLGGVEVQVHGRAVGEHCTVISLLDGFVIGQPDQLPKGLELQVFNSRHPLPEAFRDLFGKVAPASEDSLVSLNGSFVQEAVLLR